MKNLILSLFFALTLLPVQASAITALSQETVIISESIADDFYSAGRKIMTNSLIGGDLIMAGQTIDVLSPVSGDLMAAGQFLDIEGEVGDDARLVGQKITIGAMVGDSVIAFGQDVTIKNSSIIKGDFWAFGETVVINGEVQGNLRIEASQVIINAVIAGDAEINARKVQMGENGSIAGDLYLKAKENIDVTKVGGEVTYTQFDYGKDIKDADKKLLTVVTGFVVLKFLGLLAIAALLIWLFKNYILAFVKTGKEAWLPNTGIGFAVLILAPVATLLLLITVIGIPLAGLVILGYFSLIILSKLVIGFLVGHLLIPINAKTSFGKMLGSFALGLFIFMLLTLIPIVGWIAKFVAFLATLGAISRLEWDFFKTLRKAKKI